MFPQQLRDGSLTLDPRLDRLQQFDQKSRSYPLMARLEQTTPRLRPRSYTWRLTKEPAIDQGPDGACVGFAVTNELLARPSEVRFGNWYLTNRFAKEQVYWEAQKIDPWPGGSYPGAFPKYEGTSVLAGVKVAQRFGYFKEYRWTFTLRDLVVGVGYHGPAVIGVNWYDSMYRTDAKGFIRPTGQVVGGHAVLVRAVKLKWHRHRFSWWTRTWEDVDLDRSYVTIRNSWGENFGIGGDCRMTLRDLGVLLSQRGEAVFFVDRTSTP